jgi:hypothetical protein
MRLRDMKYIGFKHQRENKQDSDKLITYSVVVQDCVSGLVPPHYVCNGYISKPKLYYIFVDYKQIQ